MTLHSLILWLMISAAQQPCLPFDYECAREAIEGVEQVVLDDFSAAAADYTAATGQRLNVTSARRSLRHCAALMAAMTVAQLEGMYCRNGYPDYIQSMKDAMEKHGRNLTAEEAYEILKNRREGFISSHLFGAAIDVASEGLQDAAMLERILAEHNFTVLNETSLGVKCIHASHRNVPRKIIRE